jgi:uncharacterized coiled-coil protein SlyX
MEVVIGAIVSSVAVVVVALIGRGMFDRRIRATIGHANGRGSIVQMSETQLDLLEDLKTRGETRDVRVKELTDALTAQNFHLQGLTRFQNLVAGVRMDFESRFEKIDLHLDDLDQRLLDLEQQQQKASAQRFRIPHLPNRQVDHPPVNE